MKKKVLVFITRKIENENQLLVFDHRDHPDAGTQVPAGTVENGEQIETAVIREVLEESGICLDEPGKHLGTFENSYHKKQELFHIFHVNITSTLKERWDHTVGGDGEDSRMIFQFYWIPLNSAPQKLQEYQSKYLELL